MERTASFGYWLRRRRKALDLTQAELARQVGCAVGTIKKLEGDERRPSRQFAERLADLLAIPPAERPAFLKAARAELATDELAVAAQPIEPPVADDSAAGPQPAGTVTFLFTDIEGSSQLWAQHPAAMRTALARHDALLRTAIEAHGGSVFKSIGDAFHAAFATAVDAVSAALAGQRALAAEAWGATGPLRVRMALHSGAAELRDGDYFGHVLSRAARILAAGHGGQILLSAASWELARDHLPAEVALRDLGAHWLKSLARPEQIYQFAVPGLPADFPPLQTLDRPTTNLPAQITAFIGREREVAAVRDLLRRDDVRLVTLTGPGGAGKTRLSLEVAADALDMFEHGVWFVSLAPIGDPNLVAATISQALGVREAGGRPILELLKSYLREKRTLLLLDNFEQIVDAVPLISELLAFAPGLKVLVTSRTTLRLSGEREYTVPPLGLPPTDDGRRTTDDRKAGDPTLERPNLRAETISQYEAVRLFIERAQAARAGFAITNENAPAVAEICVRLDGLPLAIELAAARIKLFPPQALLVRLANRLRFLTGGARDLPERQQTIRNTIDWSYQLLDAGEQTLFARLGVFVGGCTIEAVEAVCNAEGDQPMEVVDGISALLDKSLLRQEEGIDGEPRFTMLETIREYALERLDASGAAEAMRRRHTAYFLDFAEKAEPKLYGPEQVHWMDRLEQEHDNLRAALRWAVEQREADQALRLGAALGWFWFAHSHNREGVQWLEAALAQSSAGQTHAQAWALLFAGYLGGDMDDRGRAHLEESLVLFRTLGDKRGTERALFFLGLRVYELGNTERAQALFAEHVALVQALGDPLSLADAMYSRKVLAELRGDAGALLPLAAEHVALRRQVSEPQSLCWSLNQVGEVARLQGDDNRAIAAYEEALGLARALNSRYFMNTTLANLGFVVQRQGDHARAAPLFRESLTISRELEEQAMIALALAGLASVAAAQRQPERATRLLGAAEAWCVVNNWQMDPTDRADYDRIVVTTRAQIGDEAFAVAWAAGRAMTLEQAIAEPLRDS